MSVKVAINGFGRIGRLAFRQMFGAEGYEIVAINDLTSPKMLAHLLKYDSAQGRYEKADTVVAGEDSITVDGKEIKIYAKPNAAELPWGEIGVDVVLECTGFYTSKEKAQAHIDAGAKKVVISAPAGKDLPTVVFGVNENVLTPDDKIISAASCTTNCLAPMANALNKYVVGGKSKYPIYTDKIYTIIFKEKAQKYRQILKLEAKDKTRDTMYSEVLDLIAGFELGLAKQIENIYIANNNTKLTFGEVDNLINALENNPFFTPLIEKARKKMASRDYQFRDALHPELAEYISTLPVDDYERFLGEKSMELLERIKENQDVLKRLKEEGDK